MEGVASQLSRQRAERRRGVFWESSIERIAEDRAAQIRQMDANLMGASCLRLAEEKARLVEARLAFAVALQEAIARDGGARAGVGLFENCHFMTLGFVSADRLFDDSCLGAGRVPDEGEVGFLDAWFRAVVGELAYQREIGGLAFGGDHDAACVFIQPMDDGGARGVSWQRGVDAAMGEDRVGERVFFMAWRGVRDQSGGFVEDEDVFVFKEDFEGDFFWREGCGFWGWEGEGEGLGFVAARVWGEGFCVGVFRVFGVFEAAFFDPLLDGVSGDVDAFGEEFLGKDGVQPCIFGAVLGFDGDFGGLRGHGV